jgi:hypothetical protein
MTRHSEATADPLTASDARAAVGIVFPPGPDGKPSSRLAGTRIMGAALDALDPGHGEEARRETHWRNAYPRHFRRLVQGAMRSPQAALASARAGLAAAWESLHWQSEAGIGSLADALRAPASPLSTLELPGRADTGPAEWAVPYRGELLRGDALAARIDDWLARGIVEPTAAEALHRCRRHPEWFDLSDRNLVLLGAGSEAGPLRWLCRWRARVIAVDLPGAAVWRRIATVATAGNGTVIVPIRGPVAQGDAAGDAWVNDAGVDLLREAPRVAAWLRAHPAPLDVAALGYADGERHVRLSLAMDMVQVAACEADSRTTLAWMATPTDVFAVPAATAKRAIAAFESRPVMQRAWQEPIRLASGDRLFHENVEAIEHPGHGPAFGLVDAIVVEQGPNYALAKRLQQWRAILAREAGHLASLNVAPSTTTASVLKNPAFAAGFAGADAFGIETFAPDTTNALMAALWVHDLRAPESAASPARKLDHPHQLLWEDACHGGLWTCAYRPRSALPMAAAIGWLRGAARKAHLAGEG